MVFPFLIAKILCVRSLDELFQIYFFFNWNFNRLRFSTGKLFRQFRETMILFMLRIPMIGEEVNEIIKMTTKKYILADSKSVDRIINVFILRFSGALSMVISTEHISRDISQWHRRISMQNIFNLFFLTQKRIRNPIGRNLSRQKNKKNGNKFTISRFGH